MGIIYEQGCEWEFKKKSRNIIKNTKNGMKTQEKANFGVFQQQKELKSAFQQQKRAEISFKAELSHP